MENQVEATEEALQLLKEIVAEHGPVTSTRLMEYYWAMFCNDFF